MKNEISQEAEAIKISLKPYREVVMDAVSVLFGAKPVVLYSAAAAVDLILLFAHFYSMGFFALAALFVLVAYVVCAVYVKFNGVVKSLLFPEKSGAADGGSAGLTFDAVCEFLASAQQHFFKAVGVLFDGELGKGPVKIAITAGIWAAITLALNYVGNFWVFLILINAALLSPSIIKSTGQSTHADAPVMQKPDDHAEETEKVKED